MFQVFAVTIRHGSLQSNINRGSYHEALLHAASHPDSKDKMLRFMLGELLHCELHPEHLDDSLYGEFKRGLRRTGPIKPDLIEIDAVQRQGFNPPTIYAHALFELHVDKEFTPTEWTLDHSTHQSIYKAVKMCWTFPWANNPVEDYYKRVVDVGAVFPLVVDEVNFMPITC